MGGARCWWAGVAVAAAGCGVGPDGYDPAMTYPLRADGIVVRPPSVPPVKPAEPGKLDESLARFGSLGGLVIDPARLPESDKTALRGSLAAAFGTPSAPRVPDDIAATAPHLSAVELANGSRLYRRHCAHCHGLTGDGRGPTGPWLSPHPRDFRQGVFKTGGPKPTTAALARVVRVGVPGTAMPALDLIPDEDVMAIIAYVVHLSLRGEAESRATANALGDAEDGTGEIAADVTVAATRAWNQWQVAAAVVPIDELPTADVAESVRRGHALFTGTAGCASCHADYGRTEQYRYDVWGGAARVPDLTRGEYRWGKEPADLARRVRSGIPGSGMPANPALSDEQVRDVVAFLRALPAPPRLPADVRDRIYPAADNTSAMRR